MTRTFNTAGAHSSDVAVSAERRARVTLTARVEWRWAGRVAAALINGGAWRAVWMRAGESNANGGGGGGGGNGGGTDGGGGYISVSAATGVGRQWWRPARQ